LVVDDSADFVCALCAFLDTLSNVDVIAKGRSGREAVVLAHEWVPDVILMEVKMPGMTGLEAASQLAREMPGVVVILMSAFEDEGIQRASEESGGAESQYIDSVGWTDRELSCLHAILDHKREGHQGEPCAGD
jgi:chemotaxis response regulator CheB